MNRLRYVLFALGILALALLLSKPSYAGFQMQRDQIAVTIIVNVTPAPIAYRSRPSAAAETAPIVARLRVRPARGSDADVDDFRLGNSTLVAQTSQTQQAVKVTANVTPNPNATMLYSNVPAVNIDQTAGTTVTWSCWYKITVDEALAWTLYDGLSQDFKTSTFAGGNLRNNTYISTATPQPAPTAFAVYSTDGGKWATLANSSGLKTYCVDLVLNIPVSVPQGSYSSNAVYTLYF